MAHQPNPNATLVQLFSDGVIATRLVHVGLPTLGSLLHDLQEIQKLLDSNDPILKRLALTIKIAGPKYATALAKPLGYFATIAIHNSAIDEKWDGGSAEIPYGSPNTPA